jgi:hypothetical protein
MAGITPNGLIVPDSVIDPSYDPGGSITWLKRFEDRIGWRNASLQVYDNYYRGNHKLQFATPKFQTTFGTMFREFADNWCPLVVDAVTERLTPTGFRMGDDADKGDTDAWNFWQGNNLDGEWTMAVTEVVMREVGYLMVWSDPDDDDMPMMTFEDASQMIVATSNENKRKRMAACKFFDDEDGYPCATVYLPSGLYKYRSMTRDYRAEDQFQEQYAAALRQPAGAGGSSWMSADAMALTGYAGTPQLGQRHIWHPRDIPGEDWPLPNPLGVVPVIPLRNKPRLLGDSESELRHVIPLQDATNKFVTDLLVASEYSAFQQRWATGVDTTIDPTTGEPPKFPTGPGTVMGASATDARFGAFPEVTGRAAISAIETIVQHIASQSRTPPHYFYLNGQFPSGESIKSAETGLVAKVRSKMRFFGEALEEGIRLAFAVQGDPRSKMRDSETIWADPESRTESEHVDAVVKRIAIGVPLQQLQEDVGYSPKQIERFRGMRRDEIADYVLAQAQALKALAAAGLPDPNAPAPGQAGAAGGGQGGTQGAQGFPVGLPNPTTNGQRDNYVSVPGSPAAYDIRGGRTTL